MSRTVSRTHLLGPLSNWVPGLRTRFVLFVAGLFLAMATAMIAVASYLDLRDEENRALQHTETIGSTVSRLAVPHLTNHHYLILEQELESIVASGIVRRAQVYDPKRDIIVDADPATSYFDDIEVDPLISAALETGASQSKVSKTSVTYAIPVGSADNGKVLGAALVTAPRPDSGWVLWSIWKRNAIIIAVLLAFGIPLAYHFGTGFLSPIENLTRTAHRVSDGDFEAPFPVERRDEIGVLARAYRDMLTRIRENMDQIHRLAFIDGVTGLPNREFFRSKVSGKLKDNRGLRSRMAVIFIDLDRFKRINDSYGHDHGDLLLKKIGGRLQSAIRHFDQEAAKPSALVGTVAREQSLPVGEGPIVARLGGDEFAIFLPCCQDDTRVARLAAQVLEAINLPCEMPGISLAASGSIGISIFPDHGPDYTSIMKSADIAMYAAKKAGGNLFRFFDPMEQDQYGHERLKVEADLRAALDDDQITVFFQPKVDCATTTVVGAEVLARWNHPQRGLLAPGAFIEVAEETGLINSLGDQVLLHACRQGKAWIDSGFGVPLAVNVSIRQLEWGGFADRVLEILRETGFPPDYLELEVTETVAMADPETVKATTTPLRAAGIRFAIDDFGTGYSSLSHLQQMPFDTFKIDRSFIAGLGDDESNRLIVQTILAMAQSLDYEVVAEGVEVDSQLEFLKRHGCTTAQGYLFGVPMAADMFLSWWQMFAARTAARHQDLDLFESPARKPDLRVV